MCKSALTKILFMITVEKAEIFKSYKGYHDGYQIHHKVEEKIISDDEWFLLHNFMQDIFWIRTGMAAKSYQNRIKKQLIENCDSEETINFVVELEKFFHQKNSL